MEGVGEVNSPQLGVMGPMAEALKAKGIAI
jgi:hypothetical protein